jgi:SAM-dependent methyltransferase
MSVRTPSQLREHYEIERELADRLRMADSQVARRRLYAEVYTERSERISHHPLVVGASDPRTRARTVAPQVRLLMPFVTAQTIFLEIGAGDGAVARVLASDVRQSIALDVTDALGLPSVENFEFRVFDGFDLGIEDESIDLAYSNDVVEHLHPDDLLDQLVSLRNCLRPGALFICVTPNRLSGPHDISRHFADSPEGFHLREYTSHELSVALRAAGFSKVKIFLSYQGRHLTPLMPIGLARPFEAALGCLPRSVRFRLATALASLKVVGVR